MSLGTIQVAKTRKGRKIISDREAKLVEDDRIVLITRLLSASEANIDFSKEFHDLLKPNSILRMKKNTHMNSNPFENPVDIETACGKVGARAFVLSSSTKKRPRNLIFGRIFEGNILDMIETGIVEFHSRSKFDMNLQPKFNSVPLLLFNGDEFENIESFKLFRSIITEFLVKSSADSVNIRYIDHCFMFSVISETDILITHHALRLLASKSEKGYFEEGENPFLGRVSTKTTEIGPRILLSVRRTKYHSPDVEKEIFRESKPTPRKVKNVEYDGTGVRMGRLHMEKQHLDVGGRRVKALRVGSHKRKFQMEKGDRSTAHDRGGKSKRPRRNF